MFDAPAFAKDRQEFAQILGGDAEAKAFLSNPDAVTRALRDYVWSIGINGGTAPVGAAPVPAPPASRAARPSGAASPREAGLRGAWRAVPVDLDASSSTASLGISAAAVVAVPVADARSRVRNEPEMTKAAARDSLPESHKRQSSVLRRFGLTSARSRCQQLLDPLLHFGVGPVDGALAPGRAPGRSSLTM